MPYKVNIKIVYTFSMVYVKGDNTILVVMNIGQI